MNAQCWLCPCIPCVIDVQESRGCHPPVVGQCQVTTLNPAQHMLMHPSGLLQGQLARTAWVFASALGIPSPLGGGSTSTSFATP